MACYGLSVSWPNNTVSVSQTKNVLGFRPSIASLRFTEKYSRQFLGNSTPFTDRKPYPQFTIRARSSICVSRVLRWWERTTTPNMIEIHSAQELIDYLWSAGDRLVVIDFYSPGCGGCKALHPKICQLAELNPNVIFLKVNQEALKKICNCLHIHVLPFFRFYRGAEGKICSFSCTVATIKKLKDALAKYGADSDKYSHGPAKGLDESELLRLASAGEISMKLPLPSSGADKVNDLVLKDSDLPSVLAKGGDIKVGIEKDKEAVLLA